jgi:hypothetical protein
MALADGDEVALALHAAAAAMAASNVPATAQPAPGYFSFYFQFHQ